jgi:diguanylate cyclase (GGDEF)-like protein/PAS domain S-box-containing protein
MPILMIFFVLLGLGALSLLVLYWVQRRQRKSIELLTAQLHRIAVGGQVQGRLEINDDSVELQALGGVVNRLLTRINPAPAALPVAAMPGSAPAPLSALADRLHEAVLIHDRHSIAYANPQFAALLGTSAEQLIGQPLATLVPPEYTELVGENIQRRLAGEPAAERYEVDLASPAGTGARLELSSWPIEHEGAPALLMVGVEVLPTQTVQTLGAQSERRSRTRQALESISDALIMVDARGRVDYLNPAAVQLLGVEPDQARGRPIDELAARIGETDRKLFIDPVQQSLSGGAPLVLGRRALMVMVPGDGERLVEMSATALRDEQEETTGVLVQLHDVTELRGLSRQISYQATHDALTGLVNRREFERRLSDALEAARRGDVAHVLCYLDLDRFKLINDTSGHQAGDSVLRDLGKLLREQVRDSDTVGRLGGDEFGMLLVGCPLDKARQIADQVCRKVAEYRFVWKDKIFSPGVSVGLVEIARDSGSMEQALAAADSACYVAKRQGGHVAVYSARDEVQAREGGEFQLLQLLQSALKDNRFELYCQPIVPAYGTGQDGPAMEVLVRLKGENGEYVSPVEFLKAAERFRLTALIDRQIVQTTLTALGRGAIGLLERRSLAINVAGQTLIDGQFLEFVVETFDTTGANPAQVCFEISEASVIANLDQAKRFIAVLHGMGCQFALDNFGSGMGSFSNLKNLGIDYLKIDGSFIRNLARDTVSQAMVSSVIRLAHTLHFKVIAEHVEDEAALDAARSIGVDFLQGYAIGRPGPLAIAA